MSPNPLRARCRTRSLPLAAWPEADRTAWIAACRPAARLTAGGRAGHLKPVTREDHESCYGYFLGFLERNGLLEPDQPAAANVTPEKVVAYVAELKGRVAPTTLHGAICRVRRMGQYIAPARDFRWLLEVDKELALSAVPRSKYGRLVLTEVLVEAGLALIHEAQYSEHMTKLRRACQVRDGLMVALLALCPIRRKNFAALEIGGSFAQIKDQWWILLGVSDTKERRADERPVDELLTPAIDRYITEHRPILARSNQAARRLWLCANTGAAMTDGAVAAIIRRTTQKTVGLALGPHMFRTAAASSAGLHGGDNPHLGSALLHHTDSDLTITHYNRATSLSAAEKFRQLVRHYTSS